LERIIPPARPRTWRDSLRRAVLWAALAALAAYKLIEGAPDMQRVLGQLAQPDLSWTARNADGSIKLDPLTKEPAPGTLRVLLRAMNETVMIGLLGTLLSLVFSFALAFPAARNLTRGSALTRTAYGVSRFILNLLRAIEPVILGLIFVFMVGPGPFAGVMALALHSVGSLGKLFAEAIEQVDPGPVEAVKATGASNFLTVWFGVLPQVAPQLLAFTLYRWDLNIRSSIILGIVGAGGIGFYLSQYISLFQYGKVATALLIILCAVALLDWASGYLREKLG
jgi:phosphonate transport system permease protein